jgi:carbonic anhydrase/acetyltransferase-like protein (isoleucine patch superfamily)
MPIYAADGRVPQIADDAFVHPDAVLIGDVAIGAQSSVWPKALLDATRGRVEVGERTSVRDGARLRSTEAHTLIVGDECVIQPHALLEGCVVEDRSFIGSSSEVLDGSRIETGAQIAARALVGSGIVVPAQSLATGRPAIATAGAADGAMISRIAAADARLTRRYITDMVRIE